MRGWTRPARWQPIGCSIRAYSDGNASGGMKEALVTYGNSPCGPNTCAWQSHAPGGNRTFGGRGLGLGPGMVAGRTDFPMVVVMGIAPYILLLQNPLSRRRECFCSPTIESVSTPLPYSLSLRASIPTLWPA